jgi:hypothetical protein
VPSYRRYRAATVFLGTFILAILVQSSVTVSGLEATHLLILLPLPFLLIGAAVALLGQWLATKVDGRRLAGTLLAALLALAILAPTVAGNLLVDAHYHQVLAQTGGKASFSSSIYYLADYLDTPHEDPFDYHRPYALDWGIKYNVELLTDGRVQPQEIYGQGRTLSPDFAATIERLIQDPNALYIAHRIDGPNIPAAYPDRTREFISIVESHGKRLIPIKTIMEGDGAPLFYVYTVRDPE